MEPLRAKKGNMVCTILIFVSSVPVGLRHIASDTSNYLFVGEYYLDDYINKEAIDLKTSRDEKLDHFGAAPASSS